MTDINSAEKNKRGAAEWIRSRRIELISLAVAALLVAVDQVTKLLVAANFEVGESIPVIENVFHLTYVRNFGAVFGSFSGKPYIFNTVTVIIVAAAVVLLLAGKFKSNWLKWTAALIISGGIGNMIDRFRLKYVIDFIDVRCFGKLWVWVFNIADCCVVIGCIMLLIYFIVDTVRESREQNNKPSEKDNENADS